MYQLSRLLPAFNDRGRQIRALHVESPPLPTGSHWAPFGRYTAAPGAGLGADAEPAG